MPPRRTLTIYQLRAVDGFDAALTQEAVARAELHETSPNIDFEARLFVESPEAAEPGWGPFLREGFADVTLTETAMNRAVVVVRVHYYSAWRYFAMTFGSGRFMLDSSKVVRGFGLRAALNAIYEGDDPAALGAPARVRRVDARTVAQNTIHTQRQTDRYATFEVFGLDIQRDLLSGVTGEPVRTDLWGSRVTGADAITLNLDILFTEVGELCNRLWRIGRSKEYLARFEWIDNIRAVVDPDTLSELAVAITSAIAAGNPSDQLTLTPPEVVDWDRIEEFQFSVAPDDGFPDLSLVDYLTLASADVKVEQMRRQRVRALNAAGDVIYEWPVFRCLSGELRLGSDSYLIEGGDFFEVDNGYLTALDSYIADLTPSSVVLPSSPMNGNKEQTEGDYNVSAANSSPNHLLLDKETVKVTTHTDPIEICDVLTVDRQFVHVKRKLTSNSLSHLFSQGYVSADLLLMSSEFRDAVEKRIRRAEEKRDLEDQANGPFKDRFNGALGLSALDPRSIEVVYAIIASWNGRNLVEALPFFSKVNLRRHTDDLRRMGYKVSWLPVDIV